MSLQFWILPGANQRPVVGEDGEDSTIDVMDKMPDGVLDGEKLSEVCGIPLLGRSQGLGPEAKWAPLAINKLVKEAPRHIWLTSVERARGVFGTG